MPEWTDDELLAFADEQLDARRAASVEQQLRDDETLRQRVMLLLSARNAGAFTLGDIWRGARVSCHPASAWVAYAQDQIHGALREMMEFHRDVFGCRECQAQCAAAAVTRLVF